MGILNLFFWLGGAVYQQATGLLVACFPKVDGQTPVVAYQAVFGIALASVAVSIGLVSLTREERPSPMVDSPPR